MSRRSAAWLAWGLCVLILVLIAGAVVLAVLNRANELANRWTSAWSLTFLSPVALAALVGGLIASHRPANPIGWFITSYALCWTLGEFTRQYAIYGVVTEPGALPLARALASPPYWIWLPGVFLMSAFLPLYFPDGRLVSPRWRPVVLLAVVACVIATGFAALEPSEWETPGIPNPLGVEALQGFEWFGVVIPVLWASVGFAAVMSLVVRFRRARGEERQQIKWFTYAAVLNISFGGLVNLLFPEALSAAVSSVLAVFLGSLWVAIAIAILKYRLYDIDVIINRTLVYGALTALLVLLYWSSVVALQQLFQALSGQKSQLAIIASTLAIAALFNPLRRRIQGFIDRRFYRRKYDAAKTLEAFSMRLRNETDLDALSNDLLAVVEETLQPAHVSLWLREPEVKQ
jgi:hypothetical protein